MQVFSNKGVKALNLPPLLTGLADIRLRDFYTENDSGEDESDASSAASDVSDMSDASDESDVSDTIVLDGSDDDSASDNGDIIILDSDGEDSTYRAPTRKIYGNKAT